tara:strand:+ start:4192 stop:5070 length:879 start_codon:yes stop_codon:yes gene_type:complete
MFPDNNWYSHKIIFNKYINTNIKTFNASIQHGAIAIGYNNYFGRILFPFIKYLVWNKRAYNVSKKNGFHRVKIIGAPFIYLNELMKSKKFVTKKNTYFIFVPHSAEGGLAPFYHNKFIKFLKKNYKGSLTACFFYRDININLRKLYKKNNINIFSCGKRNNKNFLFSLFNQMKISENIVITELGSSLFYSLFLNKRTFFVNDFKQSKNSKKISSEEKRYMKKHYFLYKNLPKNRLVNPKLGKKLADEQLGKKFLMNKNSLRKLLYSKNIIMKFYAEICKFIIYIKWKNKLIN